MRSTYNPSEITTLPNEILLSIASLLDIKSLIALTSICKQLRRVLGDDSLWAPHFFEAFKTPPSLRECLDLTSHPSGFYMPSFFRKKAILKMGNDSYSFTTSNFIGLNAKELFKTWYEQSGCSGNYQLELKSYREEKDKITHFQDNIPIESGVLEQIPDFYRTKYPRIMSYNYCINLDSDFVLDKSYSSFHNITNHSECYGHDIMVNLLDNDDIKKSKEIISYLNQARYERNKNKPIFLIGFYDSGCLISCPIQERENQLKKIAEDNACEYFLIDLRNPNLSPIEHITQVAVREMKKMGTLHYFPEEKDVEENIENAATGLNNLKCNPHS